MKNFNPTYFQIALIFVGVYIVNFIFIVFSLRALERNGIDFIAYGTNIITYSIMLMAIYLFIRKLMNRKLSA